MAGRALSVSALPAAARCAAAALRMLSRASIPFLLVALVRAADPPLTPAVLARGLIALVLLPELCARLVLRAFVAACHVEADTLHLRGPLRRFEVPCSALARVAPLRLPLPSPGFSLVLRSGERLGVTLHSDEPSALLAPLANAGVAVPPAPDPALAFADARGACPRRWWDRAVVKIGLASLVPAAIAFNAHQHIAFGGTFGEYYLMGLRAWLASAGAYWLTAALYLVLWAGCFRLALELFAWLSAGVAPRRARALRHTGERAAAALYYTSIPLLLVLRFLA
jgi:apolipoprotein N-acyltransferase